MSFNLKDSHDFDQYWLKNLFGGIKDDPWRLITGIDPISTGLWNKILGKDEEPLVNAMGGPMGGGDLGLSFNGGGIYDDAEAAGINPDSGIGQHNVAKVLTAIFATQGAGGFDAIGGMGGGEGGLLGGGEGGGMNWMDFAGNAQGLLGGGNSQQQQQMQALQANQMEADRQKQRRQMARRYA